MKQFEIKVYDNANIPFLTKLIESLKRIGCVVSEKNENIHIEFKDELEPKIQELFQDIK